jgi:hypothetical protein
MNERYLDWIGRTTLVLGLVGLLGSAVYRDLGITVGVAIGVALAWGNLQVLRTLGRKLVADADKGGRTVGLMMFKFLLLIGLIFAITRWAPFNVLGLLGGFSTGVAAILLAQVFGPPLMDDDEDETGGTTAGTE